MTFEERLKAHQAACETALRSVVDEYFTDGSQVSAAAEYALLGGGKRVRGVLALASCEMLGGDMEACRAFAAAIEMIHAFSLVHDDLPCMDDDDMRRGRPATHIKFGEATALLAGDLLAIEAFNVIAGSGGSTAACVAGAKALATAAGAKGMIYGQELDLKYEAEQPDEAALLLTHTHKTGALIRAAVALGMAAAGTDATKAPEIDRYALDVGLVFQIVDDILDVTSTEAALGKPIGSDAAQGKTTFVTMYGMDPARQRVKALTEEAVALLAAAYGSKAGFLCTYAQKLAERVY